MMVSLECLTPCASTFILPFPRGVCVPWRHSTAYPSCGQQEAGLHTSVCWIIPVCGVMGATSPFFMLLPLVYLMVTYATDKTHILRAGFLRLPTCDFFHHGHAVKSLWCLCCHKSIIAGDASIVEPMLPYCWGICLVPSLWVFPLKSRPLAPLFC